jgi:hypothetical protein
MKLRRLARVVRAVGVVLTASAAALLVLRLRYGFGPVLLVVSHLLLAVMFLLLLPWQLNAAAREEARLKAKREKEARKDRERLERIRKAEKEWLERKKGGRPE